MLPASELVHRTLHLLVSILCKLAFKCKVSLRHDIEFISWRPLPVNSLIPHTRLLLEEHSSIATLAEVEHDEFGQCIAREGFEEMVAFKDVD